MPQTRNRKRRVLSTEASLKMAVARKQVRELSPPREDIATFVLRRSPHDNVFLWQVRLFGGVVLLTSDVGYPSLEAARSAGVEAQASYCSTIGLPPTPSTHA